MISPAAGSSLQAPTETSTCPATNTSSVNCSRPVEEAFYSAATASGRALTRTDLRELGLDRRAVDAVFRSCT